jgi:hypothetical protein
MRDEVSRSIGAATLLLALVTPASAREDIAAHPSELDYPPLEFQVPKAEGFRHQLANGVPEYLVEDHALPLVDLRIQLRIGSFL